MICLIHIFTAATFSSISFENCGKNDHTNTEFITGPKNDPGNVKVRLGKVRLG
jgi:hypothetical protein